MNDHGLRIMRGWIGAFVCTSLAAASHTLVDGATPPLAILGLLFCISAVICTGLASNKISLLRTTCAVGLSQGIYHGAFALFGHQHQVFGTLNATGEHAGHAEQLTHLSINSSISIAASVEPATGLLMPLAHVLAGALTVLAIRRGEIAARAFAEAILLWVPRLILFARTMQLPRGSQPLLGSYRPSLVLRDVLRPSLYRRGPPRGPAFAIL